MKKEMIFCKYCGAEIPKEAAFCDKCGKATKSVSQETKATSGKPSKKTSSSIFPFIVAGAVIAVIGIVLAVYFLTEDSPRDEILFESIESEDLSASMKIDYKKGERKAEKPRKKSQPDAPQSSGELKLLTAKDAKPSFDCAKASTPTEKAICSDAELAKLDAIMAGDYKCLLGIDGDERKTSQREWMKKRDKCGANVECIKAAYKSGFNEFNESTGTMHKSCGYGP